MTPRKVKLVENSQPFLNVLVGRNKFFLKSVLKVVHEYLVD